MPQEYQPAPEVEERWRIIRDYPDYEVSEFGRVRRITSRTCAKAGHLLKLCDRGTGYPCVDLCRNGKRKTYHVHRLVAAAFLEAIPGCPEVNHIDGNPANSQLSNLEYVSSSQNQKHAYAIGLQSAKGELNGQAKLTNSQVLEIVDKYRNGERQSALAAQYGVNANSINRIIKGRRWAHLTGITNKGAGA